MPVDSPVATEHPRWARAREIIHGIGNSLEMISELISANKLTTAAAKVKIDAILEMKKGLAIERAMNSCNVHQRGVVDCFLGGKAYVTLASAGNQGGKSHACALAMAMDIRDHLPAGSAVWCIGPSREKSIVSQQKYLWDFLPHDRLGRFVWEPKNGFGSENPMFIFDEGGRNITVHFKFQSQFDADPDSFESATNDRVWIDEAISDAAWQALQMRMIVRKGRFIVSSYLGKASVEWLFEASRHTNPAVYSVFWLPTRENPAMEGANFEVLREVMTKEEWDVRVEGRARLESMLVYDKFDMERNVVDELPDDLTWYAGMDHGYDHPMTWVLIGVDPDGVSYIAEEVVMRRAKVVDFVVAVKAALGDRKLHKPTILDNAAFAKKDHRDTVAKEFEKAGLPVVKSLGKSKEREQAQIMSINARLDDGMLFVHRKCKETIREFRVWKYKRKADGAFLANETPEDKNNDVLDAIRYCLASKPTHSTMARMTVQCHDDDERPSADRFFGHLPPGLHRGRGVAVSPDVARSLTSSGPKVQAHLG